VREAEAEAEAARAEHHRLAAEQAAATAAAARRRSSGTSVQIPAASSANVIEACAEGALGAINIVASIAAILLACVSTARTVHLLP
jgi:nucleoside permease NupC